MAKEINTIGVLTSGGDAPGMNAAIRAVVREAIAKGKKVKGIKRGYAGLLQEEIVDMEAKDVSDIIQRGGTILQTARCMEFKTPEGQQKAAEICKKHGIDGIIVIGGDGSFRGAQKLAALGINTIGLPGTIDLDIACTEYTIGFDTAVNTAMEAIDKVRDTSTSHDALQHHRGYGTRARAILHYGAVLRTAQRISWLPEKYDYDEQKIVNHIIENRKRGKQHHIIVNAEGIGHSASMAKRIEAATGVETRATILGHMQRGGSPTCKGSVSMHPRWVRWQWICSARARATVSLVIVTVISWMTTSMRHLQCRNPFRSISIRLARTFQCKIHNSIWNDHKTPWAGTHGVFSA